MAVAQGASRLGGAIAIRDGAPRLRDAALGLYIFHALAPGLDALLPATRLTASTVEGGSPLTQMILLLVAGCSIIVAVKGGVDFGRLLTRVLPLLIPTVLIVVSIAWAVNPAVSSRRVVRFVIELVSVALLVSSYRRAFDLVGVLRAAYALVVVADVLAFAVPRISVTPIGYAGVHFQKNVLGSFVYLAAPIFLIHAIYARDVRGRAGSAALLVVCAVLLAMSKSKTPVVVMPFSVLIAAVILFGARLHPAVRSVAVVACLVLGVLAVGGVVVHGTPWGDVIAGGGGDATLTGRTKIWAFVLRAAADRPWLGYGYGGFWMADAWSQSAYDATVNSLRVEQAHNGYIDIYAQLGVAGLVAVGAMSAMLFWRLLKSRLHAYSMPFMFLTLYTLSGFFLYNISESSLCRAGDVIWINFLVVCVAALNAAKYAETRTRQPDRR